MRNAHKILTENRKWKKPRNRWEHNFKGTFNKYGIMVWLDSVASEQGPGAVPCEHGNEPLGFIMKRGEFIDHFWLTACQEWLCSFELLLNEIKFYFEERNVHIKVLQRFGHLHRTIKYTVSSKHIPPSPSNLSQSKLLPSATGPLEMRFPNITIRGNWWRIWYWR
jgi:hypothetical protein